ncbi:hypothetical protein ACWJJH_14095 [Endozoicomonadaceae bacterium StTr2]
MKKSSFFNCVKKIAFYCFMTLSAIVQANGEVKILGFTFSPMAEDDQGYVRFKCSGCEAEVFRYTRESKQCLLAMHTFSKTHDSHAYTYKREKKGSCFFYRKRLSDEKNAGWCERCGQLVERDAMDSHSCSDLPPDLKGYRFPPEGYTYQPPRSAPVAPFKQEVDSKQFNLPALLFFVQSDPRQPVYKVKVERRLATGCQYEWGGEDPVVVVPADKLADAPPCFLSNVCCFEGCMQYGFSNPLDESEEEYSDKSFWMDSAGSVRIMQGTYKRSRVERQVREDFCRVELGIYYHQLPAELKGVTGLSYCKQRDYNGGWGGTDAPWNRVSLCQVDQQAFTTFRDDLFCYDMTSLAKRPQCIDLPTKKQENPWWYMQEPQDICSVWNPDRKEYDIYISMGPTQKESHRDTVEQMRFLRFPASNPEALKAPEWGTFLSHYFFWNYCLRESRRASGDIRLYYLRQPMLRRREHKPEHVRIIMVQNPHLESAKEQEIPKPAGHLAISAIYPSNDGNYLLAFHPDDTVSIYDVESGEWLINEPVVQGNPPVKDYSIGFFEQTAGS